MLIRVNTVEECDASDDDSSNDDDLIKNKFTFPYSFQFEKGKIQ